MTKKRFVYLILGSLFILLMLTGINFVFNPLGLGPVARTVLPNRFFEVPVESSDLLTLLVDGDEAFDAILKAIQAARETIHVQTYIWKDDQIGLSVAQELTAAAERGVSVSVNKDALGTFFELGDIIKGRPSPVFTENGLKKRPNITVNTDFWADTDHSKYIIVDHREVILGGMNIADEYHRDWHDYMVRIQSSQWAQAFEKKVVQGRSWPSPAPFFVAVNNSETVEIRTALIETIDQARQSIVIEHAYFSTEKIIAALQRALERGVTVSLILPKLPDTHLYANQVTINALLRSDGVENLKVFLYPKMMHAKVMLVDNVIAAVGSANLTLRSMLTSREVMLFVHGRPGHPLVTRLRSQLVTDMLKSEPVSRPYEIDFVTSFKAVVDKHLW